MPYLVLIAVACAIAFAVYKFLSPADEVIIRKKKELGQYTRADVAQHNTRDSLWLILKREAGFFVYDVTSYLDEHPGGDAMLRKAV
jgi:hypothetical protein